MNRSWSTVPRSSHQELERRALDELLLNAGLRPVEAEIETTSAVLMKSVVISSDLLTFLPRELIHWEERAGQLCALPVAAPQWARSVGVSRLRQRRPGAPALALIEALRERRAAERDPPVRRSP